MLLSFLCSGAVPKSWKYLVDRLVRQQGLYFLAREWSCEMVALDEIAAHPPQMFQLLGALHPFPGDLQPQRVSQRYHRLHDGRVGRILSEASHERGVDLQGVHRVAVGTEILLPVGGDVVEPAADQAERYGENGDVPHALTDYIRTREGYDYSHHGQAGNPSTDFVPDDIVDRFCVLGTVEDHVEKLNELRDLGADQFNVYLMHDAMEQTLEAYGEEIIPALGSKTFR
jgi:hypothetical protein